MIIDASVAAAWLLEEKSDLAAAAFARVRDDGALVPAHFPTEIGNALLVAVRRQRAVENRVYEAIKDMQTSGFRIDPPTFGNIATSVELALAHKLTVYDAAYLELALRTGLPLATLDRDLIAAAERAGAPVFSPP